jgi:superfamily II DNA helicase RecQ
MTDYAQILNKPAFQVLEPEQKEAFRQFMQNIEGKSTMEVMGAVMEFSKTMPKGRELSKEEQNALTQALYEGLNKADQQKFSAILKMMERFSPGKKQ